MIPKEKCNITRNPCQLEIFCGRCDAAHEALLEEAKRFNLQDGVKIHDHNHLGVIAVSSIYGNVLSKISNGKLIMVMEPNKFRYYTESSQKKS